ncbi:neprilysin-1-like [Haemaphysalis longicornis]
MRSHTIPGNQASFSAYNERQNELDESMRDILGNMSLVYDDNQNATDKAAVAYNACLAVPEAGDQHEVLQQIMKDSGLSDWPLLPMEKQKRAMGLNWTEMLLNVGLSPVLQLNVIRDGVNLTSHIMQLDRIQFNIVGRDPLVNPDFRYHVPPILAYKRLIAATAKFINPNISEMQAKILANDLVHFEGMLANLAKQSEEQGYGSMFTTTIADVQKHFPSPTIHVNEGDDDDEGLAGVRPAAATNRNLAKVLNAYGGDGKRLIEDLKAKYLNTERGQFPLPVEYGGPENSELDELFTTTELRG